MTRNSILGYYPYTLFQTLPVHHLARRYERPDERACTGVADEPYPTCLGSPSADELKIGGHSSTNPKTKMLFPTYIFIF